MISFGLHRGSSLLIRVMNQALIVGLDFPGNGPTGLANAAPRQSLPRIHSGVPGASGPLGRCALVYMDDCLMHLPTLEQHLLDDMLEICAAPGAAGSSTPRAPSACSSCRSAASSATDSLQRACR